MQHRMQRLGVAGRDGIDRTPEPGKEAGPPPYGPGEFHAVLVEVDGAFGDLAEHDRREAGFVEAEADGQGVEQPHQPARLAGGDTLQQILGRLLAHPLQAGQLGQRQPVNGLLANGG